MNSNAKNFEILDGYPADVLAIAAHRRITTDDYETLLIPNFEEKVRTEGKVKFLIIFGDDFAGYSPGAVWDDAKFGFLHIREIAGVAIVSDLEWLRFGVKTFAPFFPCPVALFHSHERSDADVWISEWKHEQEGGPEVDAESKLPTTSDTA